MNKKLFYRFDQGRVLPSLIGLGADFIPDDMYREQHNRLLVVRQLSIWANTKEKKIIATRGFLKSFDVLALKGELASALRLVLSYGLVKREYNSFLLSEVDLIKKVKYLIDRNAQTICSDDSLRTLILSLEEYFPSIR